MIEFIYDRNGEAVVFRYGDYIYGLDGLAVGYVVQGTRVHKLDGDYVGEIYRDMIVDQWMSNPGSIGRIESPGRVPAPDRPFGRGPVDYGYRDVVSELMRPSPPRETKKKPSTSDRGDD